MVIILLKDGTYVLRSNLTAIFHQNSVQQCVKSKLLANLWKNWWGVKREGQWNVTSL